MDKKKKTIEEEDYGDYVTRCICEFKHDDGYMIACDDCGVWQHVECMQVDPKNLPENYLCEECEPRAVDRRRARQIQIKKRGALDDGRGELLHKSSLSLSGSAFAAVSLNKKKRKKGKVLESKVDLSKRVKKEPPSLPSSVKKAKKRPLTKPQPRSRLNSSTGSIQSLLNAASLLDGGCGQGAGSGNNKPKEMSRKFSGLWNANYSPWSDEYESLESNKPTEYVHKLLLSRLSELKSEAVVYSKAEYDKGKSNEQCSMCEVVRRRKGVVADVSIPEDELVTEYKGIVTVTSELLAELSLKYLWKNAPCPFVYQYDKMDDLDICIDARRHGNIARFIRRSCSPNAEVRHFFVEDELHFGVYALSDLSPQEEVTLALDFQHDKCEYPVECACGQVKTACLVSMTTASRARGGAKAADNEDLSGSVRGRQRSYSHVLAADEDSNSSWASNTSHSRKKKTLRGTPLSPKLSRPTSREESSDSEGEHEKRRKSLTREERKTEQVWKMFEKMEAKNSAQRKRQQLVSEGSADSADPVTSPLHVRHTPTSRERRTPSTGSRKAQLLHSGTKMRLSSVSSGDPLSPSCDLFEPFSPPTTPLLPTHTPTTPHMSPTLPSMFQPTVNVTPFLHPKYLLEEFVLPWKKAFLRKWEYESLNKGSAPARYSYWAGGDHTPYAYFLSHDAIRPRVRGSLKHRWLRQLSNEGYHSDKENRELPPLPHKKQFLLKWQESEVPVPMATNVRTVEPEHNTEGVGSGRSSPLFDDFSDGEEFELPGRKRHNRSKVKDMDVTEALTPHSPAPSQPHTHTSRSTSPIADTGGTTNDETKSSSGDHMTSHDHVSLCSDISEDFNEQRGPKTPPTLQETTPTSPISPATGPITPPPVRESTPLQSPVIAHHMNVSDISSDMDSSLGQSTSELEGSKPHPPTPPTDEPSAETIDVSDWSINEQERPFAGDGIIERQFSEGSERAVDKAPPLSPSAKTPIKRKINLSEYRNRARKPAERKTSNESKPSTSPHTTTTHYSTLTTPTLLPMQRDPPQLITMATGLPTGIAMTTGVGIPAPVAMVTGVGMPNAPVAMVTGMGMSAPVAMVTGVGMPSAPVSTGHVAPQFVAPQFEPVSPDDTDTLLPTMEGQVPQVMMGGALMNRDLPIQAPVQPMLLGGEPGGVVSMVPGYMHPQQQQQLWTVQEQAHDPRRASMMPVERQFLHEPRPPGLIAHPHYVIPQQVHPQGMMGRGFPHPHTSTGGQYLPRHPSPGSGYY